MGNDWWGYSKQHGWVVLDRTIPLNAPGLRETLLFFRFRDAIEYVEKRASWNPPLYRFADNYIRDLTGEDAASATEELDRCKARWPELQRENQRVRQEEADRIEAARVEEERLKKQAARKSKKQVVVDDAP